jgi:hypothetical protein
LCLQGRKRTCSRWHEHEDSSFYGLRTEKATQATFAKVTLKACPSLKQMRYGMKLIQVLINLSYGQKNCICTAEKEG